MSYEDLLLLLGANSPDPTMKAHSDVDAHLNSISCCLTACGTDDESSGQLIYSFKAGTSNAGGCLEALSSSNTLGLQGCNLSNPGQNFITSLVANLSDTLW